MSLLVSNVVYHHTDMGKSGPGGLRPWSAAIEGVDGYQVDYRRPLTPLWTYQVPADTKLTLDELIVSGKPGSMNSNDTLFAYIRNAILVVGRMTLSVDAAEIFDTEIRADGNWEQIGLVYATKSIQESVLNYGDGIEFTAGQVISASEVVYDHGLNNAIYAHVLRVKLYGKNTATGAAVIKSGVIRPASLGTFSFEFDGLSSWTVPAGGFTLLSVAVNGEAQADWVWFAYLNLRLNGQTIHEFGCICNGVTPLPPFNIPFGGAELYPGDKIELQGCPWADVGQSLSVLMLGSTIVIGSTGDTTPPVVSNISPAPAGALASDTIVSLDITDNGSDLSFVQVLCYYPDGTTKVVFKNGAFKDAAFIGAPNNIVPITGGYRLYIRPIGDPVNGGGWQQLPQFDVDGIDGDGNSAIIS